MGSPVLDTLKREAGGILDSMWAGALTRVLSEATAPDVQQVSIHRDCELGDPMSWGFPEPTDKLAGGKMWVECSAQLADGGQLVGALFEPLEGAFGENWPYILTSVRFAMCAGGSPIIMPGRVIVDTATHGTDEISFADFERIRHGLLPAREASESQLIQMQHHLVEVDGRYLRAIPTTTTPAAYRNMPPYRQGVVLGTDGLRAALATTCVEPWFPVDLADVDPVVAPFYGLFDNILVRGPFVALNLMQMIGDPGHCYRAATDDSGRTLVCPSWAVPIPPTPNLIKRKAAEAGEAAALLEQCE